MTALVIILVVAILYAGTIWLSDSPRRNFLNAFNARQPVSDDELFRFYFRCDEIPSDIPGRVRRIFAVHTEYTADRLLPDDDLSWFWAELDATDLIRDLESEFDLKISEADSERTACTIRAVSLLIAQMSALRPPSETEIIVRLRNCPPS